MFDIYNTFSSIKIIYMVFIRCGSFSVAVISILLFSSCAQTKQVTSPEDWKGSSLEFGYGGGFAGTSMMYMLLANGQLFVKEGFAENGYQPQGQIEKNVVREIFQQADKAAWGSTPVKEPGNTYTTLNYIKKGKRSELIWGNGKYHPSESISALYKKLFSLTLKNG